MGRTAPNPCRGNPTLAHRLVRFLFVVVGAVVGLLPFGSAHATTAPDTVQLVSVEPADRAVLSDAPTQVVLRFDKEIEIDVEPVVTLSCATNPVGLSAGDFDNDRLVLTYEITTVVAPSACVGQWLLQQADGTEIVKGAWSFEVASTTATTATGDTTTTTTVAGTTGSTPTATTVPTGDTGTEEATATEPSTVGGWAIWLGRVVSNLGILVLFGSLVVIATGWPEGPEYFVTGRFLRSIWIIALAGSLLYVVAFAAQVRGASLAAGLSPAAWMELAQNGWPGSGAVLRLILIAVSGYAALAPERVNDPNTGIWAWAFPSLAVVTLALSRVTGPLLPIGVVLGIVHVLAIGVWFGGAVFVGRVVLAGPGEEDLVIATTTYARTSVLAVLLTVVTGVAQMIRLDGSDLFSSHALLLFAKIAAVAVMLFIGLEARKQVKFRLDREYELSPNNAARFSRAYGTEVIFGVIALALSSAIVSLSPGSELPWASETYTQQVPFDDSPTGIKADVKIGPTKVGLNGYLIQVSEPESGITELKLRFIPPAGTQAGQAFIIEEDIPLTGRGSAWRPTKVGVPFGVPGEWRVEMVATTTKGVQPGAFGVIKVADADGSVPTTLAPTPTDQANVNVVTPETTPATGVDETTTTAATTTTTVAAGG